MHWSYRHYPSSQDLNYWDEVIRLDRERMESSPSTTKFPETKGLPDLLVAERKGFLDGCGGGPRELAFQYTWNFFATRRLNTRYIGFEIFANHCTAVFIPSKKEGGMLYGRTADDNPAIVKEVFNPPKEGPDGKQRSFEDGVSSSVLCDEEPTEIFPVNVWKIMPPDCKKVQDKVEFLRHYNEFWGPQNKILTDEDGNGVVIEKSNCRMGVRYSADGTVATTACSYLIPEMKAFKEERSRLSLEICGWDETSIDWLYWQGCNARYERLLKLTREANERGATLDDVAHIVTDHAVPFPDRICLAGERFHPKQTDFNWTLFASASVLEGPNRRTLFWHKESEKPCYENLPFLALGAGVPMKPEWQKGTRSLPPASTNGI